MRTDLTPEQVVAEAAIENYPELNHTINKVTQVRRIWIDGVMSEMAKNYHQATNILTPEVMIEFAEWCEENWVMFHMPKGKVWMYKNSYENHTTPELLDIFLIKKGYKK